MSRPESVSSRTPSFGSSTAIWKISLRFFSPPENPSLTGRLRNASSMSSCFIRSRTSVMNSIASSSSSPRCFRMVFSAAFEKIRVVDARNLDRILKGHENARTRPFLGSHLEQVLAFEENLAVGHFVFGMTRQYARQRALAGAVRDP